MRFWISCSATKFLFKRQRNAIFQSVDPPARRSAPVLTKKDTAMFSHLVRFVREWKRYNNSLRELNRLGDRELADIGVSRFEIPQVAWKAAQLG